MAKTVKLTHALIQRIIKEEAAKLSSDAIDAKSKKAKEVDAEDLANTLADKKDFTVEESKKIVALRALRTEAKLLREKLGKIEEQSKRIINSLLVK